MNASQRSGRFITAGSLVRIMIPVLVVTWIVAILFAWNSSTSSVLRGSSLTSPVSVQSESQQSSQQSLVDHLVMVPGHAVLRFNKFEEADTADESWYLLSYQRQQGFPQVLSAHIRIGIEMMKQDPASVLIFSGGETRKDVGPYSEALSYFFLAHNKLWLPEESPINDRVALEEYARDSFENLLFSMCRFKEVTGHYPSKISVVGFDFKSNRYTHLHRKALLFPAENFTYIGVHAPDYSPLFNQKHAEDGEAIAMEEFSHDLYGCNVDELKEKRKKRNPFHRSIPYELSCPEMMPLLHWCGPELVDTSAVPWAAKNTPR